MSHMYPATVQCPVKGADMSHRYPATVYIVSSQGVTCLTGIRPQFSVQSGRDMSHRYPPKAMTGCYIFVELVKVAGLTRIRPQQDPEVGGRSHSQLSAKHSVLVSSVSVYPKNMTGITSTYLKQELATLFTFLTSKYGIFKSLPTVLDRAYRVQYFRIAHAECNIFRLDMPRATFFGSHMPCAIFSDCACRVQHFQIGHATCNVFWIAHAA